MRGPSASDSQHADTGQKDSPAGRRRKHADRDEETLRQKASRSRRKKRQAAWRRQGHRRGILCSADGEHRGEIIRAAFLVGQTRPFVIRIVTMDVGMDRLAIASADAGHDIGPAMLMVVMDIQAGYGKQVPNGQQHRRHGGKQIRYEAFLHHGSKFSKKKVIFTIPTNGYSMKRYFTLLLMAAASLLAAACATDHASLTLSRDSRFTGRGNEGESLLTLTVLPESPCKIRSVDVTLDAAPEDVSMLSLVRDGRVLGCATVRKGKASYSLRCGASVSDSTVFTLCADIRENAAEGGLVSAEVTGVRLRGTVLTPEAPAAGPREILLCRKLLFAPGDYGSNFWRIPAIRQLSDGTLLVVNDRRNITENDLPSEIDVVSRFSLDNGATWSEPVTIAQNRGKYEGYGDPGLMELPDGTVICTFAGGLNFYNSTWETPQRSYVAFSRDHGRTWSEPVDITGVIWGPQPDNPYCKVYHSNFFSSGNSLVLSQGPHKGRALVAGVMAREGNLLCNHAVYTDDGGATWHVSDLAFGEPGNQGDEAKMVQLTDGRILMSVRRQGERGFAISEDGGQTWPVRGTWPDLQANACNGDLIRYDDSLLLHTLPDSPRLWRENVSVFLSFDEGKTWPEHKMISSGRSMYSSLTVLPDGTLGAYVEELINGVELWYERFSMDWLRRH